VFLLIIGITGGLGSGKTIIMVRYLIKEYIMKHKIYANFGLKKIKYEPLNILTILEMDKKQLALNNICVGIDELTVFADCRKSGSKLNRMISYFVLQTRKRNVTLYYTTQDISMIDLRLVDHTDIQILCSKIYDKDNNQLNDYRHYSIIDFRESMIKPKITRIIFDITKYYEYYDTYEVILPPVVSK